MTFLATLASEPSGLAALSIELPNWITPSIAGLTVGAVVGVLGFVAVLLLVGRGGEKKPQRRLAAQSPDNVVFIPPYTTLPRDTPVPAPWMGQHPSTPPASFPAAPFAPQSASGSFQVAPNRGAPPLRPSTELSARVFAKMGYSVDAAPQTLRSEPPPPYAPPPFTEGAFAPAPFPATALHFDPPSADPDLELDESELEPDEELAVNHPVSVAPVMIVTGPPPQETLVMSSSPLSAVAASAGPTRRPTFDSLPPQPPAQLVREITPENGVASAEKSAPHPLGVISSGSSAMRMKAASIADLDLEDNAATTISETIFDEPPQPRRRSEPPRIRPKAPAPPRFPASESSAAAKPVRPRAPSASSLPRVTTPPPGRVRQA